MPMEEEKERDELAGEEDEEASYSDGSLELEPTASQVKGPLYMVRELSRLKTKGMETKEKQKVPLVSYFPDPGRFVRSVQHTMKNEGFSVLSSRMWYRLRKWFTGVRLQNLLKWIVLFWHGGFMGSSTGF